jgi:hypothetical protein
MLPDPAIRSDRRKAMSMIAGLFKSASEAARVLQQMHLAASGVCVEDIRVAGHRLDGLELYEREKDYRHERTRATDAVLIIIRSETADLVALRGRLVAAGMELLETQTGSPREFSRYPYGDGVGREPYAQPPDATGAGESGSEVTTSQEGLDRDYY